MKCVFCRIIKGTDPGHMLYEDDYHVAFLDRYPITEGHSLVVPKDHYRMITDMRPTDVGKIFTVAPKIARAVMQATGADAFSLGQNNGRAAKQMVFHVHVHIIPGYNDRDTIWTKRNIPTDQDLANLAKRIRACMD